MATKKILLVDDDPNSRELLRLALGPYECRLFEAADGAEALSMAQRERPDLIILDHMMPKMTGYELFHKIREDSTLSATRFIMVTVKHFDSQFPERLRLEGCEFIAKPYDFYALYALIQKVLGPLDPRR